jgi:hypothetical protein
VLKKICWYAVLTPSYSTEEGSSSDATTLITTTVAYKQVRPQPISIQNAVLSMLLVWPGGVSQTRWDGAWYCMML